MKKLISIMLFLLAFNASAFDKSESNNEIKYNSHSYGAPTLYYSTEGKREREEQELLKESNRINQEQLNVEREQLQEMREQKEEN